MWVRRAFRTYTKEEIVKPLTGRYYKNLFELAAKYPEQGVGFKFWRKTWPENSYYTITRISFKDPRHGKAFGVLTWKGETKDHEEKVRSPLKLGVWNYSKN
mmetsp:Transcript_8475/g.12522  ORF Transcript_8475/g.12522 Transcript_8475/m.12522 type:complete len:101 (-) Transcript_8475:29-331(-)